MVFAGENSPVWVGGTTRKGDERLTKNGEALVETLQA
jgi:hypothetical protein